MCTGFSSACALAANGRLVASAAGSAGARDCLLAGGIGCLLFCCLFPGAGCTLKKEVEGADAGRREARALAFHEVREVVAHARGGELLLQNRYPFGLAREHADVGVV